ncbi:MAG: SLAC1 anion channel family protein [Patescibacteria group bacterium]|nr:SLAC1 anion channel family protein [Patescibacteria group bacterium]
MKKECRIKYFPVSFFSIILGMTGFTIAFQKAEQILQMPIQLSWYILMITILFFIIISVIYLTKIIKFKDDVKNEFNHPIKLSFFPTFSISFLLLSVAFLSINIIISKYLWLTGATIHFIFTIKIISIWIQHSKFKIKHMNPSWFIPAVGNILVPVAGVSHFPSEISWFFFSIGLFFWIALFIIFFNRIIFHNPLPDKLLPTLFILIAPPAVGFISIVKLTGEISEFSKILYYFGLFIVFLLFAQINLFRKIKFYFSWWAYSFPIAAITIATILMFHETNIGLFKYLSWILFFMLNIIIILLLIKTTIAISKREICIEEE